MHENDDAEEGGWGFSSKRHHGGAAFRRFPIYSVAWDPKNQKCPVQLDAALFPTSIRSSALLESLSQTCLIAYGFDTMSISSFLDELLQLSDQTASNGSPTQHDPHPDDDRWRALSEEWEKGQ